MVRLRVRRYSGKSHGMMSCTTIVCGVCRRTVADWYRLRKTSHRSDAIWRGRLKPSHSHLRGTSSRFQSGKNTRFWKLPGRNDISASSSRYSTKVCFLPDSLCANSLRNERVTWPIPVPGLRKNEALIPIFIVLPLYPRNEKTANPNQDIGYAVLRHGRKNLF